MDDERLQAGILLACMQVQQSGNRWYMNHDFSAM
jgi:hypothetical protein